MNDPFPSATSPHTELPDIDITVAHASRVYDYLLGGSDNFAVDRQAAQMQLDALGATLEESRADIRANRDFLGRAVRYLALEAGIRQFLDLGTGIPNADNVHGVAQDAAADARIVYVDNDPIVLAHAHSLLTSTPEGAAAYINADLLRPDDVLRQAGATLDLDQPIAVLLISMLHLVPDSDDPYGVVARYVDQLVPGSYLGVSHLTKDLRTEAMTRLEQSPPPDARYSFRMRSQAEVARFFDGLTLVEPGIVSVEDWRPDESKPPRPPDLDPIPFWCGIARKP